MSGNEKWGRSRRTRVNKQAVIAILVAISLVVVVYYYIETSKAGNQPGGIATVSTTGILCNDSSMPQVAQQIMQEAAFTKLSGGVCYNYLGQNTTEVTNATLYSFGYYNGTIGYPCGLTPVMVPQSVIVNQVNDGQATSAGKLYLLSSSAIFEDYYPQAPCAAFPAVEIVSLTEVKSNSSATPELNLTINSPITPNLVTGLSIVITFKGGTQAFNYVDVTTASPLPQSINVNGIESLLSGRTVRADTIYPVTIEGTLENGQTFDYQAQVQVSGAT